MDEMLKKEVNMLSYIEINTDNGMGGFGWSDAGLLKAIQAKWNFTETQDSGTKFYKNVKHRFLLSVIKGREHVYPALKHMLFDKKK